MAFYQHVLTEAIQLEKAEFEVVAPEGSGAMLRANIIDGLNRQAQQQIAEDGELIVSARKWQEAGKHIKERVARHIAWQWREADEEAERVQARRQ